MHTPGPWTISDDGTIESKHHGLIGHLTTVGKADRRLIAAAPLMLDALRVVVDSWTSQFERNGHLAPAWCKQARAAIEDATKE